MLKRIDSGATGGKPREDRWVLVRGARQLLTLHGPSAPRRGRQLSELGIIPDGAVLIKNGIIEAVGPSRRVENLADAHRAKEIDASGRVAMPAFVDPHTYPIPRRMPHTDEDAAAARAGISCAVRAQPSSRLSVQADQRLKVLARHGTGTVGALSGYGLDETGELKLLRAIASRNTRPLDVVSILHWTGDGCRPAEELVGVAARRKLAAIASVRLAPGSGEDGCTIEEAAPMLNAARSARLRIHMENWHECDDAVTDAAISNGALSLVTPRPPNAQAAEKVAQTDVIVTLTPGSGWTEAERQAARDLVDRQAAVALGSGMNPETGGAASMQAVMRIAADRKGLSIEQGISCATVNAAYALGEGACGGTLEYGKRADLILLNVADYREMQFMTGSNLTHSMVKRGVLLFEEEFPGWPPQD